MEEIGFIKRTLQGIAMGLANVVPGVSGGTMALILGIYPRLIHSINTLPLRVPIKLIKGEDIKDDIEQIDFRFLVPLALGVIVATLLLARAIGFFLSSYTSATYSFFFGLILASLIVVYRYIDKIGLYEVICGFAGFFFAFFIVGAGGIGGQHTSLSVFLAGVFAIASMILPGISGSFILVFLGEYEYMLSALNSLDLPVIAIFLIGGLIGLFGFAKILEYLLDRAHSATMVFLFGLMFGGLRVPFERAMIDPPSILHVVIPAVVGALMLYVFEYFRTKITSV